MKCTVHDLEVMGSNPGSGSILECMVILAPKISLLVHQYLKVYACSPQITIDNTVVHFFTVPDGSVVKMGISGSTVHDLEKSWIQAPVGSNLGYILLFFSYGIYSTWNQKYTTYMCARSNLSWEERCHILLCSFNIQCIQYIVKYVLTKTFLKTVISSYYNSSNVCLCVCLFVPYLLRGPLTDLRQTWWV